MRGAAGFCSEYRLRYFWNGLIVLIVVSKAGTSQAVLAVRGGVCAATVNSFVSLLSRFGKLLR